MAHHADAEIAECVRCPMMRRRSLAGIFVKVHPAATGSAETWKGRNKDISVSGAVPLL